MNAQQPIDYAPRVDFEVRNHGNEVLIYKKIDGHKPQIVTLTSTDEMRILLNQLLKVLS